MLIQGLLNQLLSVRAKDQVERTLQAQSDGLLRLVQDTPPIDRNSVVSRAASLLPDTRVLVKEGGQVVVWTRPAGPTYASASAADGEISVSVERIDAASSADSWALLAATGIGLLAAGGVVWLVSGAISRRLRASLRELSDAAEQVGRGRLDARAPVHGDEVGPVAEVFNSMTAELGRADARQREFLADVAHELRTPVTAIEGFAGALADGTARTEEDRREAAEFIREEAVRLRELVRSLQELTWLDLDPPVAREVVDLAELAREAVARQSAAARERGVMLTGPDDTVEAVTDPAHVATILANLIGNALKATPEGGRVAVTAAAAGGDAVLTVSDTGVGIPEEHIPFLFDRLFRVDSSRVRADDGGSGLGLSIVRRLATLLGGRITVTSEVGHGTIFTVWLLGARTPAARRAVAAGGGGDAA